MRLLKKILKGLGLLIGFALAAAGLFVGCEVHAFNASFEHVYDVPLPSLARTTDPTAIARGKHLAESIGACASSDCHGRDLGGGKRNELGPLGVFQAPNITGAGLGGQYSDGELARLLLHGIKRDGHGVKMMPVGDFKWWPDDDIVAVISYLRTVPPVDRPSGETRFGTLAKVLDRLDRIPIDAARRIDHEHRTTAPSPAPTAAYGSFIGAACRGCHGEHLSGGPIPGAPPSLPTPLNLTPDDTGLKAWTFGDFDKFLSTGIRKNGKPVDPFMPVEALGKMNDLERQAVWAYLQSLPPAKLGGR